MNTSTGQPYNTQWTVQAPPEQVVQQVTNAAALCDGYSFQPTASNSVVLTRKYWPVWVIVVAVAGALLCLLGLLALFYKETETLTVTATDNGDGTTRVDVSGTGSSEAVGRINAVLSGLPGAHQSGASYAAPAAVPPPPVGVGAAVPPPPGAPAAGASYPAPSNTAAAWLPDPAGHHELRYWNGSSWTEHVSDQGSSGTDTLS